MQKDLFVVMQINRQYDDYDEQYDDSPTIKRQKVVQLPCVYKICVKKSNTSNEIFSENAQKIYDEPKTQRSHLILTEPINLTLSPKPESYVLMEIAPTIEKNATRNS